jgi:hypothetical protein
MEGEGTNGPSRTSRGYPSLMPSASATVLIEMRQMASSSRAGDGAGDDPFPTRFDRSMDDADIGIDSIDDDVPALELSDNYERENEQYENEQHEYERTPVARLDAAPFKSWPGWQASAMLTKQMCRMLSRAHHDHSSPSPWWWPFGRGPAGGSSSLSVSASSLSPSPSGPSSYSSAFSSSSSSSSSASKSGVLRFRNTSGEGPMRGALLHILRNRAAFPMPSPEELRAAYPVAAPDMCALAAPCAGALRVTWIGHADVRCPDRWADRLDRPGVERLHLSAALVAVGHPALHSGAICARGLARSRRCASFRTATTTTATSGRCASLRRAPPRHRSGSRGSGWAHG